VEQVILAKSCQPLVGDDRGVHKAIVAAPVNHEFVTAGVPAQELKMRLSLDPDGEIVPVRRQFIEAFYLFDDLLVFITWQKSSDDERYTGFFGRTTMRLSPSGFEFSAAISRLWTLLLLTSA
jgi:hypothetical protein